MRQITVGGITLDGENISRFSERIEYSVLTDEQQVKSIAKQFMFEVYTNQGGLILLNTSEEIEADSIRAILSDALLPQEQN